MSEPSACAAATLNAATSTPTPTLYNSHENFWCPVFSALQSLHRAYENISAFVSIVIELRQQQDRRCALRRPPSSRSASDPRYNPWRGPQRVGTEIMRIWLRSVLNAILGRVPGRPGRPDTATRMAMDAHFIYQPTPPAPRPWQERDDGRLFKPVGALADAGLLEEMIRIVNEAQERDAEDERRLYVPRSPRGSHSNDGSPIDDSHCRPVRAAASPVLTKTDEAC